MLRICRLAVLLGLRRLRAASGQPGHFVFLVLVVAALSFVGTEK